MPLTDTLHEQLCNVSVLCTSPAAKTSRIAYQGRGGRPSRRSGVSGVVFLPIWSSRTLQRCLRKFFTFTNGPFTFLYSNRNKQPTLRHNVRFWSSHAAQTQVHSKLVRKPLSTTKTKPSPNTVDNNTATIYGFLAVSCDYVLASRVFICSWMRARLSALLHCSCVATLVVANCGAFRATRSVSLFVVISCMVFQ